MYGDVLAAGLSEGPFNLINQRRHRSACDVYSLIRAVALSLAEYMIVSVCDKGQTEKAVWSLLLVTYPKDLL